MKLFKFSYSPYARKVQAVLDLAGVPYEAVEVPYGDRRELVAVTRGYLQVPVVVDDTNNVWTESRDICERVIRDEIATLLTPPPFEGPIWAFADFCDGPLEDVLFRIATPLLVAKKNSPEEQALFVYIKERKFGAGCVARWQLEREDLVTRAQRLLAPIRTTLCQTPFLFGKSPTLADAALYGNLVMLEAADSKLPAQLGSEFPDYIQRIAAQCSASSRGVQRS